MPPSGPAPFVPAPPTLEVPTTPYAELFVSPTGGGSACTFAQPCSLTQARDRARVLSSGMPGHIVISLMGGLYTLETTFALTPLDSGKNGYRIFYQAYPGETPVLGGGINITGWVLFDGNKNIYRAPAPAGLRTRQLYVNGKRATRARSDLHPSGFIKTASGYLAPDGSMASWRNPADIEIVELVRWKNQRCGVASISGTSITMKQPCWSLSQAAPQAIPMGLPTWIENAYELLNQSGHWYHDRSENYLYYIPRSGEDMAIAEVIAPALETLLRIQGTPDDPVQNITFSGLTFTHSTWNGPSDASGYPSVQAGFVLTESGAKIKTPGDVWIDYAQGIVFWRNTFRQLGATALVFGNGSKQNQVTGNIFEDISSGAITMGDVDQPNTADLRNVTSGNWITNNYIASTGQDYFDSTGIFVGYTDTTIVAHNEVTGLPYTGISVGWGWGESDPSVAMNNQIINNRVHQAMQRQQDGGMIYTLSAQPNSVIWGNHLLAQTFDYAAIYLDEGTRHFIIGDNVISSAPYWLMDHTLLSPGDYTVKTNYVDASAACTFMVRQPAIVVPLGGWTTAALNIMDNAGLEAEYQDIRPGVLRLEAETYGTAGLDVGYHDSDMINAGGIFRNDGVDIYSCLTCSNDHIVGQIQTGEWLTYSIYIPKSGLYDFDFIVAADNTNSRIQLMIDGVPAATMADVPDTGNADIYQSARLMGVNLPQGPHIIRTAFTGSFNFDYFTITLRQ
ncbi:f5/8 type C domain protein [Sulfuricaulis limicola]|uniref:F5/8 type C domain protein n=1 Tax=Sulfuricaulis limicola TaxID=1620215 RepID=A0A1B4XF09_9GAMM|nr:f5/8 type C domain protein [Sulfuricaulis limicola]